MAGSALAALTLAGLFISQESSLVLLLLGIMALQECRTKNPSRSESSHKNFGAKKQQTVSTRNR
jgi:hypothetical protein